MLQGRVSAALGVGPAAPRPSARSAAPQHCSAHRIGRALSPESGEEEWEEFLTCSCVTCRPFLKDKKNTFAKELDSPKSSTKGPSRPKGQSPEDTTSKRKQGQETEKHPRSRINKGLDGSLVGARIKVWWPGNKMFYKGVVESFDSSSKRHKVAYDDGDVEVLLLSDEKWNFIKKKKRTAVASETPWGRKRKGNAAKEENTETPKSDAVDPPKKRGCPKGWRPNNGTPSNNSSATPSTKGKTASKDVPKTGSNLKNEVEKTSKDKACSNLKNEEKGTSVASETTLRRHKDKSPPSLHPLDLICEAIGRDTQDVGARAQHFASVGEDQNNMNSLQSSKSNMNSLQKMVDFGGQGLDSELEQDLHDEPLNASANDADQQAQRSDEHVTKRPLTHDEPLNASGNDADQQAQRIDEHVTKRPLTHDEPLNASANDAGQQAQRSDEHVTKRPLTHDEPLNASANDADQQAQRSDEHVTKRPLTTSNGEILKKHKATAEMPCIQETGPVHQESRSAQANVNKQEATQGKDYSISRCLDVLEAMDDVPDGMKILASDVFRDATNREMFLCYAPRLRGPWLKKELEKLHGPHRVN